MKRSMEIALVAVILSTATPALASELSPWLGSADQIPFQLDPTTMVAVTFAADPLQTGSLSKPSCLAAHCKTTPDSVTHPNATGGASQK
jgi:hypothetical protein